MNARLSLPFVDSVSELQTYSFGKGKRFLQKDQSAKFTAQIPDIELTLPELNLAVHPRDGLVVETDITLRAPAYLYHLVPWSNHIDGALSGVFFNLLKNEIRLFWPSELHKVDFSVLNHDLVGQRLLAQLTLELRKTVD